MISTRTAAIRFGVSKSWLIKTAEMGVFASNFEVKVRRFFYIFFAGPLVVGAGVALAGLILHRTAKNFIAEVFLQDSRLLDWWATRPGFRLRRVRKARFRKQRVRPRFLVQPSRRRSLSVFRSSFQSLRSKLQPASPSLFKRVAPPLRPYFYRRRSFQRSLSYLRLFGQVSSGSGLSPYWLRHANLRRKHRSLIKRGRRALSRRTFFRFRGPIRPYVFAYFRKRVGVVRPYLRRRLRMFRRLRRFHRPRRRRFRRRRVRRLKRYWFIRRYASIYRRFRKLPLKSIKRTIHSHFKRVRPHRTRARRRRKIAKLRLRWTRALFKAMGKPLGPRRLLARRRLKKERRKRRFRRLRRRRSRRGSRNRFRRSFRNKKLRRRRVFRRATSRLRRRFFYRMPRFFRLRLFVFFARIASLMAYQFFGIPVRIRLNFIGYRGTLDFYLNYITTKLYYRYILNDVIKPIVRLAAHHYRGFRIVCNGRFTRAQMATTRIYRRGSLRSNMVSIPLAYGQRSVILKYGTCNLKIWLRY